MKIGILLQAEQMLQTLTTFKGTKFNYCIIKNIKSLAAETETIRESLIKEFTEEEISIITKYSGNDKVADEDKEIVTKYNKVFSELINQDTDFEFYKLKNIDDLPNDLDVSQTDFIMNYILE